MTLGAPFSTRLLSSAAVGLLFAGALIVALRDRVPGKVERPLSPDFGEARAVAVEIPGLAYQGIRDLVYVHRITLRTDNVGRIASYPEIRLLLATYGTRPVLRSGRIELVGTSCRYETARGATVENNTVLVFEGTRNCRPLTGHPTGDLAVVLRFDIPGRVALWTYYPEPETTLRDVLVVWDSSNPHTPARPVVRGSVAESFSSSAASRRDLLAFVWQIPMKSQWLDAAVCANAFLLALAVFLGWDDGRRPPVMKADMRRTAAVFVAALGLAASYAVIVPPFQAADEPNHFMGLAGLLGRPELGNAATAWAQKGHFEEIQFHPDRRFNPVDRYRTGLTWDDGVAPDQGRGTGVQILWTAAAPLVGRLGASEMLLAMRLLHSLLYATAAAFFLFVVSIGTDARRPELLAIPLFLVPTLPYFAMYVSNYAPLASLYVVMGAGVVVALRDGPRAHLAGPLLGFTFVAAAGMSRSAVPLLPFLISLLLGRIALGQPGGAIRSSAIFWGSIAASAATVVVLSGTPYFAALMALGTQLSAQHAWLPRSKAALLAWTLVLSGAGFAVEQAVRRTRMRAGGEPPAGHQGSRVVMWVAWAAAIVVAVLMIASLFIRFPTLPPLRLDDVPTPAAYVRSAVLACLTMFRFGAPDHMTSVTFWGGFGWLDTFPSFFFIAALAGSSGCAVVALLIWIAATRSSRLLAWCAFAVLGYVGSVSLYAFSIIRTTPADLHGRYMLGLYLCVLLVAWSSIARVVEAGWVARPAWLSAVLSAGCGAAHVYCLIVILHRYF